MEPANAHYVSGWLLDYFEVFHAAHSVVPWLSLVVAEYSILAYIALVLAFAMFSHDKGF